MPRWYYKPAIVGFELQERGAIGEPKVFLEEKLSGVKHHVIIRRQRDQQNNRPDIAEFANPILSDPHAVIEFTRDGRLNVIDKSSERGTFRLREGRNKFQPDVVPASIPLPLEEGDVIQLGSFLPDDPASPLWLEIKPIYDRTPLSEVKNGRGSASRKSRPPTKSFTEPPLSTSTSSTSSAVASDRDVNVKPKGQRGRKRKRDSLAIEITDNKTVGVPSPKELTTSQRVAADHETSSKALKVDTTGISESKPPECIDLTTDMGPEKEVDDADNSHIESVHIDSIPSATDWGSTINTAVEPVNDSIIGADLLQQTIIDADKENLHNCELWLPPVLGFDADEIPGLGAEDSTESFDWTSFMTDPYENENEVPKADSTSLSKTILPPCPTDESIQDISSSRSVSIDQEALPASIPIPTVLENISNAGPLDDTIPVCMVESPISTHSELAEENILVEKPFLDVVPPVSDKNDDYVAVVNALIDAETVPGFSPSPSTTCESRAGSTPSEQPMTEQPIVQATQSAAIDNEEHTGEDLPEVDQSFQVGERAHTFNGKMIAPPVRVSNSPPLLLRAGSMQSDISSELGDNRIQYSRGNHYIRKVLPDSSPESSPGVDSLSPYLGHGNTLPRLRKCFGNR